MFPALLPIFRWADTSWLSLEIRASTWQFAILEMIHLIGLTMLLGTLWILNLRIFGIGMRKQSIHQLAQDLSPWMWTGLLIILSSGVCLFFGEPMKLYGSPSFHVKMILLAAAIVFQVTFFKRATVEHSIATGFDRFAAGLSLLLWFGVGLAGRAIGFL